MSAVLPGPATDATQDAVTARAYRHPALADRTVVRLVGATVGPAEDLTMEFLGFTGTGVATVGHGPRQALGFPAWALVHDPAHARHALALVHEMAGLARTAGRKPGLALDGYRALAQRLGEAAPQLLPTFWEQAGRAFLAADNQRSAGTCFTEARRAEQVHGLPVDESRVRDVHLEFAFAGALTASMLSGYAREVAGRRPGPEAYQLVKTLSLRRVGGGLLPHASMAADLARLATAAGLDAEAEADEVAGRLLGFPAMARAHPAVWQAYRKSLSRLGRRDAAVRARLLEITPDPAGYQAGFTDQWLELLADAGAVDDLVAVTGPAWPGSAGQWLQRLLRGHHERRGGRRSTRLLALVERLAPRLIAEGGVQPAPGAPRTDLDVLDLCLALGVPATVGPLDHASGFRLERWVADDGAGRRELTAIAADPVLRPLLRDSVRGMLRRLRTGTALTSPALPADTLRTAFGAAGPRAMLTELAGELAERAGTGTVAVLDEVLTELGALWSPDGMALAADAFHRLRSTDLAAVLARNLRGGLLAELTWPAYEQAVRRLEVPRAGTAWPEMVLHDVRAAQIVRPDGSVTEHVFRFPAGLEPIHHDHVRCAWVDGDLLVSWFSRAGGHRTYWSSRPDEVVTGLWAIGLRESGDLPVPLPIPGGGLTVGSRPVRAGEMRAPDRAYRVVTDGQAFWRCERHEVAERRWEWRWQEFDPRTGEAGRISVPAFFAAAGGDLVPAACALRPVPAGFAGSPLGVRDGMTGWRVTAGPGGVQTGEGIDGRRVRIPDLDPDRDPHRSTKELLLGAVLLPGGTAPLPVTRAHLYPDVRLRIWTAGGEHPLDDQVELTATLPPLDWWHGLRARDEAGSAALRAVDETTAAALLAVDDAVTGTVALGEAAAARVAAHLPAITDDRLRARVGALVARTVVLRRRIAEISRHLAPRPDPAPARPPVGDSALRVSWDGLCDPDTTYYSGSPASSRHQITTQIQRIGAMLADPGSDTPADLPALSAHWVSLLAGLGGLALRAASPITSDADRAALAHFLATVAGTPLDGSGPPVRVLAATQESMSLDTVDVHRDGPCLTVLLPPTRHFGRGEGSQWRRDIVQVAPDGVFPEPAGLTVRTQTPLTGRFGGDRLRGFLALLAERGPAPWRPAAADELAAATGMTRATAVLLLAGLPGAALRDGLGAQQRARIGLTAAHAKAARITLTQLTFADRIALLDAAMPAEPADLWTHGPDVAAIAERWIALRGRQAAVSEDLVAEFSGVLDESRAVTALSVLTAIAAPTAGDWLTTDGRTTAQDAWQLHTTSGAGEPFEGAHLRAAGTALAWLAYRLPWGDPLRAALPEALRLVRERLRNPDLLIGGGFHEPDRFPDLGPVLVEGHGWRDQVAHHLVPAWLSGADDPALEHIGVLNAVALRIVLSDWIDRAVSTPDGVVGDPHDPRVSAPDLVAEVAERHRLAADAAAYYLQLLALPDPADRAVLAWNGWKTAALRAAQRALTEAGLVVAAKRARAGRPVFLPGGWQEARAPRLPVESWKQAMYAEAGRVRIVPMPLPELFRTAWGRVLAGDPPRYHELQEKP
ncbi:hypothetical protein BJY16_003728 [Actinoplanes octamycinicus]|uniref:DNA-binding protein n=1 Tax=Actinoplanes octamycinicus TaxID=135948 RepID=A0A7W7M7W6_9ACTN|nr:hypothetical protein [Actinoplanes octamycinicus]MBB4740269.1 hypothetical protein [Actinoplanes octamycinicus]GIE63483.1 hypothetical protein Aoc01nite_88850 [Actinoplanes octamycinicus]